jgi:hypothetical protein
LVPVLLAPSRAGGAAIVRVADEGGVVDLRLQLGAVGGIQDPQVVDPGGLRLLARPAVAGAGLGVPVAGDDERDGLARGPALVPHVDIGQIEGVLCRPWHHPDVCVSWQAGTAGGRHNAGSVYSRPVAARLSRKSRTVSLGW